MQKKVKFRKMRELVYQNYRSYMQAPLRAPIISSINEPQSQLEGS
jgi:hypothetical protein